MRPVLCSLSESLRADYYFIWRGRYSERVRAISVRGDGFRHVQGGEFDLLNPESSGRVVGCDVEAPVGNGISGDFLAVAVSKNENGG